MRLGRQVPTARVTLLVVSPSNNLFDSARFVERFDGRLRQLDSRMLSTITRCRRQGAAQPQPRFDRLQTQVDGLDPLFERIRLQVGKPVPTLDHLNLTVGGRVKQPIPQAGVACKMLNGPGLAVVPRTLHVDLGTMLAFESLGASVTRDLRTLLPHRSLVTATTPLIHLLLTLATGDNIHGWPTGDLKSLPTLRSLDVTDGVSPSMSANPASLGSSAFYHRRLWADLPPNLKRLTLRRTRFVTPYDLPRIGAQAPKLVELRFLNVPMWRGDASPQDVLMAAVQRGLRRLLPSLRGINFGCAPFGACDRAQLRKWALLSDAGRPVTVVFEAMAHVTGDSDSDSDSDARRRSLTGQGERE